MMYAHVPAAAECHKRSGGPAAAVQRSCPTPGGGASTTATFIGSAPLTDFLQRRRSSLNAPRISPPRIRGPPGGTHPRCRQSAWDGSSQAMNRPAGSVGAGPVARRASGKVRSGRPQNMLGGVKPAGSPPRASTAHPQLAPEAALRQHVLRPQPGASRGSSCLVGITGGRLRPQDASTAPPPLPTRAHSEPSPRRSRPSRNG